MSGRGGSTLAWDNDHHHKDITDQVLPVPGGVDSIFADVTQDLDILASDGGGPEGEAGEDQGDSHPLSSELSH